MLVVIGMIAIVTAIAMPSLRGIYRDFRMRQTLSELDTFTGGLRSCYLIMNEFPSDPNRNFVKPKDAWCLPRNFYSVSSSGDYELTPHPYGEKSGGGYDIDLWLPSHNQVFFSIKSINDDMISTYKQRLQQTYPHLTVDTTADFGSDSLGIPFPEIDGSNINQYR